MLRDNLCIKKTDKTANKVCANDTMHLAMKNPEHYLITSPEAVSDLCLQAYDHGVIGLDTEFMREKAYFAELCLLQIAIGEQYYLIDTLALFDEAQARQQLADLIANDSVIKIVHSCSQDIEVLSQYFEVTPQAIFDTQLAAGFCGYDGQIGYANLVLTVCDVELDKSQTRTNWQQRPLSQQQLEYAVNDVVYLYALYEKFSAELVTRGRQKWFNDESLAIVKSAIDNQDPKLAYMRLNGSNMSPKKQRLLAFLAVLREKNAQASNKPRPWILKDADLYSVAQEYPDNHKALFSLGISAGFVKRNADKIIEFVQQDDTKQAGVWQVTPPLTSEQKSLVKMLSKNLNEISEHQGVARSLIANRKDIEGYISGKEVKFEHGWRAELLGDSLSALLVSE